MQTIEDKMISRIYGHGRGWAFTANDFSVEFGRSTIDWVFYELVAKGTIRRIARGIYDYPKHSELLQQELSPDFDQVSHALARKFNWRIQSTGDAALNLLRLSTQVPGRPVYFYDGPSRSYKIDNFTLEFKKSVLKDVGFNYRESGLVVQALKALGKEHINQDVIKTIREQLDEKTRKRVLNETVTATGWVYDAIKKIAGSRGHGKGFLASSKPTSGAIL